ncbi:gamma-glutamylcyclotransferase family protein [Pseudomonas sp. EA_35y_Pfl2_R111]|uniref:gamma-glutamylcyclotransferase family protein n=1 Tax=Pseudomonas sp. EA_35y_Pfl2_R111 TaxID=3088689 RepID=UPI0030D70451
MPDDVSTTALDHAAFKTGSDAHLQPVNSASSPVFALPGLRSLHAHSASDNWYFAYGSNMNPARMQARGLTVLEVMQGRLPGYSLCFNKRAADRAPGRAYANIRYQRDGLVEGVLYRLQCANEIRKLDHFEGTPIYYSRERLAVIAPHGVQPAWVYIANPAFREEGLLPSVDYLAHLLAGRELLSEAYWSTLSALPFHPD